MSGREYPGSTTIGSARKTRVDGALIESEFAQVRSRE